MTPLPADAPLILVVDDEPGACDLMVRLLPQTARVQVAVSGEEALQLVAMETPDLVLLDLGLPGLGGEEVLRRLRADPACAEMAVIVVTGDASEEGELASLELGADDFVVKPINPPLLRSRVHNLLQRVRLQRQVLENQRRYTELFQSMAQGVIFQDRDGVIIDANPAACEMLGLDLDQLLGKASRDPRWGCIHADGTSMPGEEHPPMIALATGRPVDDVTMGVFHPHDNDYRWLLVSSRPEFEPGEDRPVRVFSSFTDITPLRRAEREARRVQRFNDAVAESTGGVLVAFDLAGTMVYVNQEVERRTGFTRDELLGQPVWMLIPPEREEGVKKVVGALKSEGLPNQYENEWLTKDGRRVPFRWYNTVLLDDQGKVDCMVAQGHDISELLASEADVALEREQQQVMRTLLENGFDSVSLEPCLQRCLQRLLELPWLNLEPKGAVFLSDPDGERLYLAAEIDPEARIRRHCTEVPFGTCLCGQVAITREMIYACQVDRGHEINPPGGSDHGHYCLPLLAGERLLGVMVLYLSTDYRRDPAKEHFLQSVSNILANIIQRMQDEETLRRREALYRRVLETVTDGFWRVDAEGRLVEVNEAACLMLGYSRDEMLQMRIWEIDISESRQEARQHMERIRQAGNDLFVTRHRAKDGRVWTVEVNVSAHIEGDREQYFVFARDVTEREEMRLRLLASRSELEERVQRRTAELEKSRLELLSIIDHLPASLFIKDLEGRYVTVNRRFEEVNGMPRERVVGQVDAALFPEHFARLYRQSDREVLESDAAITREEVFLDPSGTTRTLLTTKLPLRDNEGAVYGLLGIATDITEIKALQAQLSLAQAIAHLGSWELDIGSGELHWSDETYRLFGIEPGAAVTLKDALALCHPADIEVVRLTWDNVLQGKGFDLEHRILVRGEVRWVREQARVTLNERNEPTRAQGSVQDITDVQRLHEALLEALQEAEKLARVRSEFLANMSHEIRTPLNGILGLAQIGRRESQGRRTHRLFEQLFESGQLLLGIVNDILDFSKIEAGKLNIESIPVQLKQVLRHVTIMCSDRASEKGFTFFARATQSVPEWFLGDPLRLSQILVNLVGNAIKFTEEGEVELSVDSEPGQLLMRVRDTGIGIAADAIDNLFKPFEQEDGSISRRFGGTGLGLAITHRLVEMMGGEIRVESTLGKGSTFEVRLPLTPVEAPADALADAAHEGSAVDGRWLQGLRILAAEDNPVNRMVLEDMLAMEGVQLVCVEDGQEALERIEREGEASWDILLTDIHMPRMNGFELATRLRERAPGLPILGVTAMAMAEERDRCLACGMVSHLAKPIMLDELLRAIRQHARRPAPDRQVTEPATPARAEGAGAASLEESTQAPAWPLGEFIDQAQILARYDGRQAFVNKVLATLLHSHGQTAAKLREAARAGDPKAVAFTAHSLAGVAAVSLADGLSHYAREVEHLGNEGDPDAVSQALELADQVDRLMAQLKIHVDAVE